MVVKYFNMDEMYSTTIIYKDEFREKMILYKKAIESGNSDAMVNLAVEYNRGLYIKQDYQKAIQLYKKAIELNNVRAMIYLARIYRQYINFNISQSEIKHNQNTIIKLYEMAINKGSIEAIIELALYYYVIASNTDDYKKCIGLYELAISKGDTNSYCSLAHIYRNGLGIEINYSKAYKLYNKGMEYGSLDCTHNLGDMYLNGLGITKNRDIAYDMYQKCAKRGDFMAMYKYALLCNEDNDVNRFVECYLNYCNFNGKSLLDPNSFFRLKTTPIKWHIYFHKWWPFNSTDDSNKCIKTLLLICKHRNASKIDSVIYICKLVMMNIIEKYCQIVKNVEKTKQDN
jgi:TPR repeat protein